MYCLILLVVASERGRVQTNFVFSMPARNRKIVAGVDLKLTGVARIRVTTIIH